MNKLITKKMYEARLNALIKYYEDLIQIESIDIHPGWINLLCETIDQVINVIDEQTIEGVRISSVVETNNTMDIVFEFPETIDEKQLALAKNIISETKMESLNICQKCGDPLLMAYGPHMGVCKNHKIFTGRFEEDLQAFEVRTQETVALVDQYVNKENLHLHEAVRLENTLFALGITDDEDTSEKLAMLKILDHENIKTVMNNLKARGFEADSKTRIENICKALLKRNEKLPYCPLPESLSGFDDLLEKFPNFDEVINLYKRCVYLAKLGDGSLRVPPILLLGEPGIGKTQFTKALAEVIGTEFLEIHMETEQNGSSLSGSSSFWSNSKPGDIFNLLTSGQYANPMVLIDELDKTMSVHYSPTAGLYRLLEVETAKTFEDESVNDVMLNAEGINWIITANDIHSISEPILSRVTVFEIQKPDFVQSANIAKRIYQSFRLQKSWGTIFDEELSDEAAEMLASHEPRKIKSLMEICFANAAIEKSSSVLAKHIPKAEKTKGTMRFV